MKLFKNYPVFFFSKKEKQKILAAIGEAEKNTSGEVRVHLEYRVKGDLVDHAKKVFEKIGMTKTAQRNGVLIFLTTKDKKVAILGDAGIHERVGQDFWNEEVSLMQKYFRENRFAEGVAEAVLRVGEKLKSFFPCQAGDKNELPDGISY